MIFSHLGATNEIGNYIACICLFVFFVALYPWDSSPSFTTIRGEYVWNFFQASKIRESKIVISELW